MRNGEACIVIFLFFGLAFTPTVRTSRLEVLSYPMLVRNYNGNTLYVWSSGPENYSKIQEAVDNASIVDKIFFTEDPHRIMKISS
jgi:hypothetical protein